MDDHRANKIVVELNGVQTLLLIGLRDRFAQRSSFSVTRGRVGATVIFVDCCRDENRVGVRTLNEKGIRVLIAVAIGDGNRCRVRPCNVGLKFNIELQGVTGCNNAVNRLMRYGKCARRAFDRNKRTAR